MTKSTVKSCKDQGSVSESVTPFSLAFFWITEYFTCSRFSVPLLPVKVMIQAVQCSLEFFCSQTVEKACIMLLQKKECLGLLLTLDWTAEDRFYRNVPNLLQGDFSSMLNLNKKVQLIFLHGHQVLVGRIRNYLYHITCDGYQLFQTLWTLKISIIFTFQSMNKNTSYYPSTNETFIHSFLTWFLTNVQIQMDNNLQPLRC